MMKRYFRFILAILLCIMGTSHYAQAQDLSEADIKELFDKSSAQFNAGQYQEALPGLIKVAEQAKAQRSENERQAYIDCQRGVIQCYFCLKQYEKGFQLADTILNEGVLSEPEKTDIQQLYVLNGYLTALNCMKMSQGNYSEARVIFNKIRPFADSDMQQRINKHKPLSWYLEGAGYRKMQQHEKALFCMEKSLAEYRISGISDGEMDSLSQMGAIKTLLCDWMGALNAYREAEKIAESNEDKMRVLVEQSRICDLINDYEDIWKISERMDSLASSSSSTALQISYNSFRGKQAEQQGNLAMAERWYLRNKELVSNSEPADRHKHYVNLRTLYTTTRNWDKALKYATLSSEEYKALFKPTDADYYFPFISIADIYRQKGDSVKCFQSIDSLFHAASMTKEPRELYQFYSARARSFSGFGRYDKALADYKRADSLLAAKYAPTDEDRVMLLPLMAGMEYRLNNYPEAESLYAKYAELTETVYGPSSMNHINAVGYLANAEAFAGHIDSATHDYVDAASMFKSLVRNRWPYLTSSEKEGYWNSSVELLYNMTPFALKAKECNTSFTEACYNGLILTKAFLLESEQSTYDLIKRHGIPEDLKSFSQIQYLQKKIEAWERDGKEYADSILDASTKVNQLESSLSKRCRAYGDATAYMDIDYDRIKQALKGNDILMDFTDFISKERGRVYAAYTVKRNQTYPQLQELFPERAIDSLNIRHPHQYYSGLAAERIYELLWKPLEKDVPDGATVYYVPSQLLFQIALESIPMGDGTLLGDHYHFVRLSSARELVRYNHKLDMAKVAESADAVLYGGLDYSLDDATMLQQSKRHKVHKALALRGNDNLARGDSLFYELPGSREEIKSIDRILKKARYEVIPYSDKEGTEESFLSLDKKSPHILHLATHGFYYTPDAAEEVDYLRGYTDAMSLSGIVFAGGNAAWLGHKLPDNVLGGIVTASDIARMDLSAVEMAVLSSCHSGNGEATPEGLYGLQRAFKKAGAKTVVMSLWAESDVVGPEFMAVFYENLIREKWDKHKAFDRAKDAMRVKYPDSPSFWAGFVMLD